MIIKLGMKSKGCVLYKWLLMWLQKTDSFKNLLQTTKVTPRTMDIAHTQYFAYSLRGEAEAHLFILYINPGNLGVAAMGR